MGLKLTFRNVWLVSTSPPRKRTWSRTIVMSALCQKQTLVGLLWRNILNVLCLHFIQRKSFDIIERAEVDLLEIDHT